MSIKNKFLNKRVFLLFLCKEYRTHYPPFTKLPTIFGSDFGYSTILTYEILIPTVVMQSKQVSKLSLQNTEPLIVLIHFNYTPSSYARQLSWLTRMRRRSLDMTQSACAGRSLCRSPEGSIQRNQVVVI